MSPVLTPYSPCLCDRSREKHTNIQADVARRRRVRGAPARAVLAMDVDMDDASDRERMDVDRDDAGTDERDDCRECLSDISPEESAHEDDGDDEETRVRQARIFTATAML